ncbi:MAG TPA: hypoxanthine-guanine phosphoribosyltransferase [Candidatus Binatia bacterium]|nr:hypoxanthine-guanine phosphoribosyltransferase [Candidatus Binatia bacterium]
MSDLAHEAQTMLRSAECLHDAQAVQHAYDRLAARITAKYAALDPLFLCVMIGGLVPAAELTRRLEFPFELDYLHATRYRGRTTGTDLVWKAHPTTALSRRHVLVIDDILDEGHTLLAVQQALRAEAPAGLETVVLCEKRHARRAAGARAEYVGLEVEDRYVFGCGMDYKGYFRQLPGIWAVKA